MVRSEAALGDVTLVDAEAEMEWDKIWTAVHEL